MSARGEAVIRSVVREIIVVCTQKGAKVSEALVTFIVKSIVLDPSSGLTADGQISKEDLEAIVTKATERILDAENTVLNTIKMQLEFDANYATKDDVVASHKEEMAKVMQGVDTEIIATNTKVREELEVLYRKIVSACLLRANLGSATDLAVVRETTAALESVLPPSELGTFMSLKKDEKLGHLSDLALIVAGIRLFNKSSSRGGAGIPDLTRNIKEIVATFAEALGNNFQRLSASALAYASYLDESRLSSISDADRTTVTQLLVNARQVLFYVEVLLNDTTEMAQRVSKLLEKIAAREDELKKTVQSKSAVSTDRVFPQFIDLGELWHDLQEEQNLAKVLSTLLASVLTFATKHDAPPVAVSDAPVPAPLQAVHTHLTSLVRASVDNTLSLMRGGKQLGERVVGVDAQPPIAPPASGLELLTPEKTHDYDALPVEYNGFCPVLLAQHGVVVPIDRSIGLLRFDGRVFGFSTAAAAAIFSESPDKTIQGVSARAKAGAELIELLQMHREFALFGASDASPAAGVPVKCDGGVQTELHPIASNIDKSYEWNEWELRRKAIKLANLRTKATHSTQTERSNFRRENGTQVYLPKENSSQTKKDSSTNTSKPVTYIDGLRGPRGPKAVEPKVVDLTLHVGGKTITPTKYK